MKLSTLSLSTTLVIMGCGATTQSLLANLNTNHEGVTQNQDGSFTSIACHESGIHDNAYDLARENALSAISDTCNGARTKISGVIELGNSEGKNGDKFIYCTKIKAFAQCE